MNKVTVTKVEMNAISLVRDSQASDLDFVLNHSRQEMHKGVREPLNFMSLEQIVLAWHGYAEVEPDFVGFEEAMRALKNGIDTYYHNEYETMRVYAKVAKEHELMHLEVNRVGLLNLVFEGKWSIEREGDKK